MIGSHRIFRIIHSYFIARDVSWPLSDVHFDSTIIDQYRVSRVVLRKGGRVQLCCC